ncbi:MAG: hypothetical protein OEW31_04980, partial [Thermoleophilia bacterium]|nr:hypothetical protein [Thermoleophilia bacterium]
MLPPPLVLGAEPSGLAGPEANQPQATVDPREREHDAVHRREALLPDGVLDDDGHDVPAAVERVLPRDHGRRRKEVREHEHEARGRYRAAVGGKELERRLRAVHTVSRIARERVVEQLARAATRAGCAPRDDAGATAVLEEPCQAAGLGYGVRDQPAGDLHRLVLAQPGEP